MICPSILSSGTLRVPLIVVEKFYTLDPGYSNTLESTYKNFSQDLRYTVENNTIIIYRQWGTSRYPHVSFSTKNKQFVDLLIKSSTCLVEFHVFVLDYEKKPVEMFFCNMMLFENKEPKDVEFTQRPKCNVKGKNGKYLSYFKKKVNI